MRMGPAPVEASAGQRPIQIKRIKRISRITLASLAVVAALVVAPVGSPPCACRA
jgi:hypothetical protein